MLAAGDVDVRGVDCKCIAPLGECVPPEDPNKLCHSLFLIRTKTLEPAKGTETADYCKTNPADKRCSSILTVDLDEKKAALRVGKPKTKPKIGSQRYHDKR